MVTAHIKHHSMHPAKKERFHFIELELSICYSKIVAGFVSVQHSLQHSLLNPSNGPHCRWICLKCTFSCIQHTSQIDFDNWTLWQIEYHVSIDIQFECCGVQLEKKSQITNEKAPNRENGRALRCESNGKHIKHSNVRLFVVDFICTT